MTQSDLARVINSTVEPLSDIARTSTWRRIEQAISEPVPRRPAWRSWAVVGFGAAAVAVAAAMLLLVVSGRSSSPPPARSSESLVAAAGEQIDRRWPGGELTLHGPGTAELVREGEDRITVIVADGTVVVRREVDASARLSVRTPTLATDVIGEVVTVRVYNGTTVMATGEERLPGFVEDQQPLELLPPDEETPVEAVQADVEEAALAPATETKPARTSRRTATRVEPSASAGVVVDARLGGEPGTARFPSPPIEDEAPQPASPTLDEIYAAAEQAIRRGDRADGEKLLRKIIREDREGVLATSARYDLALLAMERNQYDEALKLVDSIISAGRDPNLRESALLLRCRILEAQGNRCSD